MGLLIPISLYCFVCCDVCLSPVPTMLCLVQSFSHVRRFVIPWTVAHQTPLSMESSRQEYWSPSPGDLPTPGIKLVSPALADGFFTTEPPGRPMLRPSLCYFQWKNHRFHFAGNQCKLTTKILVPEFREIDLYLVLFFEDTGDLPVWVVFLWLSALWLPHKGSPLLVSSPPHPPPQLTRSPKLGNSLYSIISNMCLLTQQSTLLEVSYSLTDEGDLL